jgi:hypothetical protein
MDAGSIAFLDLVLLGFVAFTVSLLLNSWKTRDWS